jgi:hypothetical protein
LLNVLYILDCRRRQLLFYFYFCTPSRATFVVRRLHVRNVLFVAALARNLDAKEFAKCMKEQKLGLTEPEVRRSLPRSSRCQHAHALARARDPRPPLIHFLRCLPASSVSVL